MDNFTFGFGDRWKYRITRSGFERVPLPVKKSKEPSKTSFKEDAVQFFWAALCVVIILVGIWYVYHANPQAPVPTIRFDKFV